MEDERVVQVRAGGGIGSGYLIAPRLVLTAAHVVPPDGHGVTVSFPEPDTRFPAVVRWRREDHDGTVDAALLEIPADDREWPIPGTLRRARRPQRWGRCVTGGSEIGVAATGFPRQQRTEAGRGRESLTGRVRPHGGATLEILDDAGLLPVDTPGTATPWSGMSGAAVFPLGEKLLLGVVRADRRPRHGTRLTYTRSEDLLACADFRAVVREATGADPQLEPAELAGLLEPAPPKRDVTSPTMLLRADAEVVSFHGRQDTLADLERWCLTEQGATPAVRVLTGPGGQGKTRLARELMTRLRNRGWVAGQVRGEPDDLRVLRTVQHPLLLVVDYAESRPQLVRRLRKETEEAAHPVRLLLLARSLGSWRIRATGALPETRLHALSPGGADREHAFRTAARDLSRRMAEVTGETDTDWPGLADTLPAPRRGAGPRAETALTIQMAALAALLRHVRLPQRDGETLEDELLGREYTYWVDTATRWGMGPREEELLPQAVTAAVLCPARDEREARATIARLLPYEPPRLVADVAAWLRELYPPPDDRYWGQLEPDRLAEYQASEQIAHEEGLLRRLFDRAPDHQRVQTLTVLARAAVAHANEGRTDRAYLVIERLREAMRSVPADAPLTAAVLRAHSDALPDKSHVLRDHALDVARELSRLCRATGDDPQALRDRAWALHNLAERHRAVGDWENAREAAGEAAAIREALAGDGATTARTEWADSLLVLSQACRMTGRLTQAQDAGDQALVLFRALAEEGGEDWAKRERGLVRALVNQARVLWWLDPGAIPFDQIARSDEYTDEAVRRARELVDRYPDLDPLLLATALDERVNNLWHFKRHAEALTLSEETVATSRRLVRENPDAYAADLARALMALNLHYSSSSRPAGEGMRLLQEAIELLRPLARDVPGAHRSTLAQMLHNLAWDQFDEGLHAEARESIAEAIEHRRSIVRHDRSGIHVSNLAQSFSTLATFDAGAGDHQAAVRGFKKALEIYERAPLGLSVSELNNQSGTALNLALSYDALGLPTDAVAAQNQALAIRRHLSEYAPSLYTEGYATSLHDGSYLYHKHDRPVAERILLRQALPRYRRLSHATDTGREGLAWCLHDLGASYARSSVTVDRAISPLTEAYELRVELAAGDAKHETELADTCAQLGRALLMTGRFDDGVRIAEHEVRLRRTLLVADRAGQELGLCRALLRLAEGRAMTGHQSAWDTALEAEKACMALVDRPGRPPLQTAFLLERLARALSLCGRHDWHRAVRAVEPARRAVRIYRSLVDQDPDQAQAELRWGLLLLARVLDRVGLHDEAIDVQLRKGSITP